MNLSSLSKGIAVGAVFLVSTIILYLLWEKNIIPFIIFILGFGIVILILVAVIIKPDKEHWKEITIIPVKRKRKK
jgi:hypothetical protein